MKRIFFYAITFITCAVWGQTYNPSYKRRFAISNDSNVSLVNQKVHFTINTAACINSGKMQSGGEDIRFTADSCDPSVFYDFWIQDGINTSQTNIWVNIPYIPADSSVFVLMWYGDHNAIATSNFNQTFPNQYFSNGNDTTLSGSFNYDWFQLDTGDVLNVTPGNPLSIKASVIVINGVINANGRGYSAPLSAGNGNGPGGGLGSLNAGAGGGSYGGVGGTGGMDPGDTPGNGGSVYDLINNFSISMGSSGGTTDNAVGGNGGGKIDLSASQIILNGTLTANGDNGIGHIGRCGGGGSGGGILLAANTLTLNSGSNIFANGGSGGNGISPANDGGGGGAGGRIKLFYSSSIYSAHNFSVLGGAGGLYGSSASATNGDNGTYFDSNFVYPVQIFQISAEVSLEAEIIDLDSIFCLSKDTIPLNALPSGGWFNGPGVLGNYFIPFNAGVGIHEITYEYFDVFGCPSLYDTAIVEVLNIPTTSYAFNNGPVCEGETLQLNSGEPGSTYYWVGPGGFTSVNQNPIIPAVSNTSSGSYTVVITNPSGCTSSVTTGAVIKNAPDVTVSNTGPICINSELLFEATGGAAYSWIGPNGFNSVQPNPTLSYAQLPAEGTYTVTVSGTNGCTSSVTTAVDIQDCYNNTSETDGYQTILYPNPVIDKLWIESKNSDAVYAYKINLFDLQGREVHIDTDGMIISDNKMQLDLSSIHSGIYIIAVNINGRPATYRIQKE